MRHLPWRPVWWEQRSRSFLFAFARHSPSPRCCRPSRSMWKRVVVVGQCAFMYNSVLHSIVGSESGQRRRDTSAQHAHSTNRGHIATFTQEYCYRRVGTKGKGKASTPLGRPTIYYDDVSSSPRPKAHWYILTHRCCDDTAPYWTPHHTA